MLETGERTTAATPLARLRRNGDDVRTVIVRLFEPAPGTGPVGLRGIVEDLVGGTSEPFSGSADLLNAIEGIAAASRPVPGPVATTDGRGPMRDPDPTY